MKSLALAIVAAVAFLACGDNDTVTVEADAGMAVRGSPVHGGLSLGGDRPLVICRGTGCGPAAAPVRGYPPQQLVNMLPACQPDGTGASWGLYIADGMYCTQAGDTSFPYAHCDGYSRGIWRDTISGCRVVALEGGGVMRNLGCVSNCATGAF